jgi:hypothetical protein
MSGPCDPKGDRVLIGLLLLTLSLMAAACGPPSTGFGGDSTTVPPVAVVPAMTALPLGDGKISTAPRVGYVFACQTAPGGLSAPPGSAPWISGSTWNATIKPTVSGSISWANASVSITRQGPQRVISANNLPLHPTGVFPIARTDPAYQYDGNPNSILQQNIFLQLPGLPLGAAIPSCVPQGIIGFTVSGAALYNALDASGRDAAAHEVQDHCAGHPQSAGQYHYHSWSPCFADIAGASGRHSDLVGYARDGFGIFGPIGEMGQTLTNAALDVCHGHTHAVSWDGQSTVLYHYHMTREYPYSVGCFHGTPVAP